MITLPLFISATEIAFILFVLVMVFGADKIPEIAKGLGHGIRGIKGATEEIKGQVLNSVHRADKDANKVYDKTKKLTNKDENTTAEKEHSVP